MFPGNPTDSELRFTLEKELHGYFYFEQPNYDGKNPATSATEFFLLIGHLPHICPFWVGTNMSYHRAPLPFSSKDTGGDKLISVQRDGALVLANKLGQTSTKYLAGYRVLRL